MPEPLSIEEVRSVLEDLKGAITREECRTCDCMQGLLTQLELDAAEDVTGLTAPFKTTLEMMHGCLGCDPCPPGALFAAYIRRRKDERP